MPYKELSDSYLMTMTKTALIRQLRCAEHNFRAMEDTVKQQYENTKDWQPVVHAHWVGVSDPYIYLWECSNCGNQTDESCMGKPRANYCSCCGAKMDEVMGT